MNLRTILFPTVSALALAPLAVCAHTNPDFDDDATPILRMQPGLIQYVHSRFEVKDTGTAKIPGDDDVSPQPPFIFRARPIGSSGAFNLRLLIQPGPPGHILNVVDITKAHIRAPGAPSQPPAIANQPAPNPDAQQPVLSAPAPTASSTPAPAPAEAPAANSQPTEPTADTPSGPVPGTPPQSSPSLTPPPDPAPA